MVGFYSIILGTVIVIISLYLVRKEFQNSFFLVKKNEKNYDDRPVYEEIVKIEEIINSMNEAFYDLIEDMEGRSSLHDFDIKSLSEKIVNMEDKILSLENRLDDININNEKYDETVLFEKPQNIEVEEIEIREAEKVAIKDKIIILRSRGMSVNQIARELDLGIGEINLILNMKK